MPSIRLLTLGSIDLRADGVELATVLAQPKRLALLAFLASARPAGFHSRDSLLALFWPESDSEKARNNLRQALHQLRKALGEGAIVARGEREVGIDPGIISCDAADFDRLVAGGHLPEALALYRGDFLPGLHVQDAPEAERWVDEERAHRRRVAVESAWKLADVAEASGDLTGAGRWARSALALDPTDEGAVRRAMSLLERAGDPAGALEMFADFARRLRTDFEMGPSRETAELARRIGERPAATTAEIAAVAPAPRPARSAPAPAPGPTALAAAGPQTVAAPTAPTSPTSSPTQPHPTRRVKALLAAAAVGAVALAAWFGPRLRPDADAAPAVGAVPATPSIAVLPFVNMSGDPANEFLSDGMTEELLHLLAGLPGLHVAARTSSFAFKGRDLPVDSIARALRVAHVLEGSVRQAGDGVRITAQLIDAKSGYHVWSGTFDTRVANVVAVQDSIGRAIVERLQPRLGIALRAQPPRDSAAHVATMKGWRAFRLNSAESYSAAASHFTDAIARDSSYGYAWAGLATVRHWQGALRFADPDSSYAMARRHADRALALDSNLVDAWLTLGRLAERVERELPRAESLYARAAIVAPSDARPHGRRAVLLARLGRPDSALAAARRAVALDPASPGVYADLAGLYHETNRFADAERAYRQALSIDPGHPILLGGLAIELAQQRKYAAAESAIVAARRAVPGDANAMGRHAFILTRLGRADAARRLLDSAETRGLSLVEVATTLAAMGDTTAALARLERALAQRDDGLTAVLDTAMFPELRGSARYDRIVRAVRGTR